MIDKWSDVSIEMYKEIISLDKTDNESYSINIMSILADKSIDELEELNIDTFQNNLIKSAFLNKSPRNKSLDTLKIGELTLHRIPLMSMTVGEFIDLENLVIQDLNKNIGVILSVLYRVKIKSSNPLLFKDTIEPYGDYIYHREALFDNVRVTDVYGALGSYMAFRKSLFKSYAGLFRDDNEDDDTEIDVTEQGSENNIQMRERLEREERDKSVSKWGWDSMIVKLANNDVLKLDAVTNLPVIQAFNTLSITKELKLT